VVDYLWKAMSQVVRFGISAYLDWRTTAPLEVKQVIQLNALCKRQQRPRPAKFQRLFQYASIFLSGGFDPGPILPQNFFDSQIQCAKGT
jgi:hypothetical protein